MFYLESVTGIGYMVTDTSDNSREWLTFDQLEHALSLGIKIEGVTDINSLGGIKAVKHKPSATEAKYAALGVGFVWNNGVVEGFKFYGKSKEYKIILGDICDNFLIQTVDCNEHKEKIVLVFDHRVTKYEIYGMSATTMDTLGLVYDVTKSDDEFIADLVNTVFNTSYSYRSFVGDERLYCELMRYSVFVRVSSRWQERGLLRQTKMFLEKYGKRLLVDIEASGLDKSRFIKLNVDKKRMIQSIKDYKTFIKYMRSLDNTSIYDLITFEDIELVNCEGERDRVLNYQWKYFMYGGDSVRIWKNMVEALNLFKEYGTT